MIAIEKVKKLSRERLSSITLLTGDDVGLYSQMRKILLSQINYNPSDLTQSYFDMGEVAYQEIAIDLESLPFFADEKVVILDQVLDLTTAKKRYLSDEDLKRLETYIESPVETTKLILLAPGKLDSKRRIVKLLKRDAQVFEASELKENELRQYFSKEIQHMRLDLSGQLLEELLIKSNFDFSQIQQNLTLLQAYKGDAPISQEDLNQALPKSLQDNIFDLTQLILKRQIDAARNLVKDLVLQGEDEIKLIAIMLNQFRLFTQVKILQDQGKNESQMVSQLSELLGRKVNPYQVKFAIRDSRQLTLKQLKNALATLIETDYQIKSGLNDKAYLFDIALLKIAQ